MKRTANFLLKGLIVIVLFTTTNIGLSSVGVNAVSEAKAAVSYQQVYQYLVSRGYEVVSLKPITSYRTEDWVSHTILNGIHYMTTIHVQGNEIIVTTDVPM